MGMMGSSYRTHNGYRWQQGLKHVAGSQARLRSICSVSVAKERGAGNRDSRLRYCVFCGRCAMRQGLRNVYLGLTGAVLGIAIHSLLQCVKKCVSCGRARGMCTWA